MGPGVPGKLCRIREPSRVGVHPGAVRVWTPRRRGEGCSWRVSLAGARWESEVVCGSHSFGKAAAHISRLVCTHMTCTWGGGDKTHHADADADREQSLSAACTSAQRGESTSAPVRLGCPLLFDPSKSGSGSRSRWCPAVCSLRTHLGGEDVEQQRGVSREGRRERLSLVGAAVEKHGAGGCGPTRCLDRDRPIQVSLGCLRARQDGSRQVGRRWRQSQHLHPGQQVYPH